MIAVGSPRNPLAWLTDRLGSVRRTPPVLAAAALLCGAGLAASGSTLVRAADQAGVLDFLRSEYAQRTGRSVRPASPTTGRGGQPGAAALAGASRESFASETAAAKKSPARKSRVALSGLGESLAARRTMCVRTCDGFTFPLGVLSGSGDVGAHAAACDSACPGAETRLYTFAPGQSREDPSVARSVADGSPYKRLPTAFLFRKERVAACSCQGPDNVARRLPILLDPTLRSGDVVVDKKGAAKVYAGNGRVPHAPRAFADFRGSRTLTRAAQAQVDRLMGVSQREAQARAFERSLRIREASARVNGPAAFEAPRAPYRLAALREVSAPAGSAANVRVFSPTMENARLHASGARIIEVR